MKLQRENVIHQGLLWGNIIRTCPGLSGGNTSYTYTTGSPWGDVYEIHEEYIHAHTRATSCYKRKL